MVLMPGLGWAFFLKIRPLLGRTFTSKLLGWQRPAPANTGETFEAKKMVRPNSELKIDAVQMALFGGPFFYP